ncbi:hypothetical protein [Govanella unica]|uniref:Uncharacterized protein n=1 Tax=Govanella unica TaxID=2975056 RepID=A0A9X3TW41_9PROT|nr:hypothetical protein [Govania unica]MDA5192805.1 hypothetical protein [Govania unica]
MTVLINLFAKLSGARGTLTLIALAAAAAALYAWGATGRADRDRLATWAGRACAATGTDFAASTIALDGKPRSFARGEQCEARIRDLARSERETVAATARTLAEALADHDRKSAADLASARKLAAAAARTAQQMEQANAKITSDNRVGADWFGALNDLAGLRHPDH